MGYKGLGTFYHLEDQKPWKVPSLQVYYNPIFILLLGWWWL